MREATARGRVRRVRKERKSVGVDFDGVIHQWDGEWRGHHMIPGEPVEGAIEWLHQLLQTYDVFILTTRGESFRGRFSVRLWLRKNTPDHMWMDVGPSRGLRHIPVTDRKSPALMYVDDRAFRFNGTDFPSANRVRGMRPWWKEKSIEPGGKEGLADPGRGSSGTLPAVCGHRESVSDS